MVPTGHANRVKFTLCGVVVHKQMAVLQVTREIFPLVVNIVERLLVLRLQYFFLALVLHIIFDLGQNWDGDKAVWSKNSSKC